MRTSLSLLSAVVLAAAASTSNAQEQNQTKTILELAAGNAELSTLAGIVTNPDYAAVPKLLSGPGPFTVFAPTNAAFEAANVDPKDVEAVTNVLLYHVLQAKVASGDLKEKQFPPTLLKNETVVSLADNAPQVLAVTKKDNAVTIGFGLESAKVTTADVQASNGVIHIIDKVLLPPVSPSKTAAAGNFTTLVELLKKAELVSVVDELKGVTIFAPTDEAFKKLGDAASKLTADELKNILKFHVVPSVAYSTDAKNDAALKTVQGGELKIKVEGANISVNGAKVVVADVLTSNGVIHAIDTVLMPTKADDPTKATPTPAPGNKSAASVLEKSFAVVAASAIMTFGFLLA